MPQHRFAHAPLFDVTSKGVKVYCRCGKQSPRLADFHEADKAYRDHQALVGIADKQTLR